MTQSGKESTCKTEILFVGPESAGKTVLIKCLSDLTSNPTKTPFDGTLESPVATVGTNLTTISLSSSSLHSRSSREYILREVGGLMIARWGIYVEDCSSLVFVVDCSDVGAVTTAVASLHEVLANREFIKGKSIAIALNKSDLCDATSLNFVENNLISDDIATSLHLINASLWILKGNCRDGSLPLAILDFLQTCDPSE